MVDEESSGNSEEIVLRIRETLIAGSQIFLDYDGTLVPIVINPENCYADERLRSILMKISDKYDLFIVSGRQVDELRKFISLDINLIGMHGAVAYIHGKEMPLVRDFYSYRERMRKVIDMHLETQYDGLRVYDKSSGILFHLGLVPPDRRDGPSARIAEIAYETGMELYRGKSVLELKIPGVNKGDAIRKFRNDLPCLIAGDEKTDESAFVKCSECITIHVGSGETVAEFRVMDVAALRNILDQIA